jgi:hypothetical protein
MWLKGPQQLPAEVIWHVKRPIGAAMGRVPVAVEPPENFPQLNKAQQHERVGHADSPSDHAQEN